LGKERVKGKREVIFSSYMGSRGGKITKKKKKIYDFSTSADFFIGLPIEYIRLGSKGKG